MQAQACTSALRHLLRRCLDFFTIMYLECPRDADLQQLFLWVQEKALFGAGAYLWNPSPGMPFASLCSM